MMCRWLAGVPFHFLVDSTRGLYKDLRKDRVLSRRFSESSPIIVSIKMLIMLSAGWHFICTCP